MYALVPSRLWRSSVVSGIQAPTSPRSKSERCSESKPVGRTPVAGIRGWRPRPYPRLHCTHQPTCRAIGRRPGATRCRSSDGFSGIGPDGSDSRDTRACSTRTAVCGRVPVQREPCRHSCRVSRCPGSQRLSASSVLCHNLSMHSVYALRSAGGWELPDRARGWPALAWPGADLPGSPRRGRGWRAATLAA